MEPIKLAAGVYWVGAIDWDIRYFHGLTTPQGSTYNSYLIVDDKVALVDAVRRTHSDVLLQNIAAVVDPAKIDYVISNHSEPDHSGSLPDIMDAAPNAELLASKDGVKRLSHIYGRNWNTRAVEDGEELSLGSRSFRFIYAPLLHWPETMFTYDSADEILFCCDPFGAHVATTERFTDELGSDFVLPYTRKYYAFLIAAFRKAMRQAVVKTEGLKIDTIAPSHGPVWRGNDLEVLRGSYSAWTDLELEDEAVIVYASMWGATRRMVYEVAEGLREAGLRVRVFNLEQSDPSDVISQTFLSRLVLLASPTFVSGIYPPVEAFIPYLRIPRDKTKKVGCFGSFGWGGGSVPRLTKILQEEGYEVHEPGPTNRFFPGKESLEECRDFGRQAAKWAKE